MGVDALVSGHRVHALADVVSFPLNGVPGLACRTPLLVSAVVPAIRVELQAVQHLEVALHAVDYADLVSVTEIAADDARGRDVEEVPAEQLEGLELEYVGRIDEALAHTLSPPA